MKRLLTLVSIVVAAAGCAFVQILAPPSAAAAASPTARVDGGFFTTLTARSKTP